MLREYIYIEPPEHPWQKTGGIFAGHFAPQMIREKLPSLLQQGDIFDKTEFGDWELIIQAKGGRKIVMPDGSQFDMEGDMHLVPKYMRVYVRDNAGRERVVLISAKMTEIRKELAKPNGYLAPEHFEVVLENEQSNFI